MPLTNKVVKFGIEDEVLELAESGLGPIPIAEQINYRHPEIEISHMGIWRFLKSDKVKEIQRELIKGDNNLEQQTRDELRDIIDDMEDETHEIFGIMKKALKRIIKTSGDDMKVIKAARDTLYAIEQSRRNLITKVEEGFKKFGIIEKAKENNYIQINNQLSFISNELCPKCRKEVSNMILNWEEKQNGEL